MNTDETIKKLMASAHDFGNDPMHLLAHIGKGYFYRSVLPIEPCDILAAINSPPEDTESFTYSLAPPEQPLEAAAFTGDLVPGVLHRQRLTVVYSTDSTRQAFMDGLEQTATKQSGAQTLMHRVPYVPPVRFAETLMVHDMNHACAIQKEYGTPPDVMCHGDAFNFSVFTQPGELKAMLAHFRALAVRWNIAVAIPIATVDVKPEHAAIAFSAADCILRGKRNKMATVKEMPANPVSLAA